MPKVMKVREVIKMIEKDGWEYQYTRGSHRQYRHPSKSGKVTIPGHLSDELSRKTFESIFQQAQMEVPK